MLEPYLLIDLASIQHNANFLKYKAGTNSELIGIIKADAYGHGAFEVCQHIDSIDTFAVARMSEGIALKIAGITKTILVFSGINDQIDLMNAVEHDLVIVVHSESQVNLLKKLPHNLSIRCWLKYDSGMHRLGLHADELNRVLSKLNDIANIEVVGIMSHYSSADSDPERSSFQLDSFNGLTLKTKNKTSITNSAGLIQGYFSDQDFARVGISLFGVSPFRDTIGIELGLKASQTLKAFVTSVRFHAKGEPVGYNGIWVSKRDTLLAVIGIGYADGYPRSAKNGTPVVINGIRYFLVGRVSMDLITVEIGFDSGVKVGDEVILWGETLPVEHIAKCASVIPYELLTGVSNRVRRLYSNKEVFIG